VHTLSVYLSMFEQTLLTHPASARKTGALAASFVAQSALLGVLLVGPLLYKQAMPMIPIFIGAVVPPVSPPPPPPVVQTVTPPSSSRSIGRVWAAPSHVPTGPIRDVPTEITFEALPESAVPGIPGIEAVPGLAVATIIPSPRVELPKQPAARVEPAPEVKPIRVSGGVLAAKIIKRVVPNYPLFARQAHVSGTVHLQATLSKDGRIENLRVIDGPPLLRQSALDAVSQWVYSPTILNGQPVEVEAPIEVNFTLN
jgi:periplasmic protein TonB